MTGFNAKIGELQGFGLSTGRILKVESRRLLESVMRQTFPKDKRVGEKAIIRDLSEVFYGIDNKTATNAEPMTGVSAGYTKLWVTRGSDRNKVVAVKTQNFRPNISMQTMESIHNAARKSGIVSKGRGKAAVRVIKGSLNAIDRVVIVESRFEEYRRLVFTHVGKLKSGFAHALLAVGGSAGPAWVKRHLSSETTGFVRMALEPGPKPFIVIANTAAGADPRLGGIVKRALAGRVKAISTNIRRMIKHGAGKSGDYGYARA